jgi:hypothetical protein
MVFNYAPYSYSEINALDGCYTPSEIHDADDFVYWYWFRSLFQRAASTLEFDFPEKFTAEEKDFFYYCLLKYGFVCVFNSERFGLSFNPCTLYGFDLYYQPTNAIVTNPALSESLDLKINKECALIKLTPDYLGVFDIIDYYASKLANMSCSLDMTVENSKTAFVMAGKTKSAIQTLKKIVDLISHGKTTIVADGRVTSPKEDVEPFTWLTRNAKESYVGTDLLQDIQTILNMFDREIGIPTIPYQKKERMVDFESKSAMIDSSSRLSTWIRTLEASLENVNSIFGTNFSVEARIDLDSLLSVQSEGGEAKNE